jgi:F0F1-type ATP synthase membrane subunit c/vacuolar-type H+-ATPase subunit K
MHNITIILVMLISTLGPAAVVAYVGYAAVRAVGRNPSAAPRILLAMIVAFIFAEAIAIVSVLMLSTLFK